MLKIKDLTHGKYGTLQMHTKVGQGDDDDSSISA